VAPEQPDPPKPDARSSRRKVHDSQTTYLSDRSSHAAIEIATPSMLPEEGSRSSSSLDVTRAAYR
jgi:hypothetical protein